MYVSLYVLNADTCEYMEICMYVHMYVYVLLVSINATSSLYLITCISACVCVHVLFNYRCVTTSLDFDWLLAQSHGSSHTRPSQQV